MEKGYGWAVVLISFVCLLFSFELKAQEEGKTHSPPDNIEASDTVVQDMPEFYHHIKKASEKRKWTQKIYSAVIVEPKAPVINPASNVAIDEEYRVYKGKTIHKIHIVILDPLGTDVNNPDSLNNKGFNKTANKLHQTTKEFIVRNNLQFKVGDALNPLILADNEVYLRDREYIHDARIRVDSIPLSDAVEVTVIVRDVFPIGANIHSFSTSRVNVEVFDRNFMGLGSRAFGNLVYRSAYDQKFGYGFGYKYSNIFRTFIDVGGSYLDDIESQHTYISAERPLLTTFKYFGQASYDLYRHQPLIAGWDSLSPDYNNSLSLTLGKAVTLKNDRAIQRLVFAARYLENLPEYRDITPNFDRFPYQFVKRKMFLTQISLYQQAYYREYLIHNYGVTENVAYGYNLSAQLGYNKFVKIVDGMYGSLSASGSQQFHFGNVYLGTAISSYFDSNRAYEGVLKGEMRYFTPLMRVGKSRLRQFLNVSYAKLLNPARVVKNVLYYSSLSSLNTSGFNNAVTGQERLMLNIETDLFSPINLIGFRFLFYTFGDIGWITPSNKLFKRDNLYGGAGVGVRIRNDLLVFKTIDFRFGFYPRLDQGKIRDYIDISSSNPTVSPNFVPDYPKEISLE